MHKSPGYKAELNPDSAFRQKLNEVDLLTSEQEHSLWEQMQPAKEMQERGVLSSLDELTAEEQELYGDTVDQYFKAREELVLHNLRLVRSIAAKLSKRQQDIPDAFQDGVFGLYAAAGKFDASKGFRFSTYATWWIKNAVSRGQAVREPDLKISNETYSVMRKIGNAQSNLSPGLNCEEKIKELETETGLPAEKIKEVLKVKEAVTALSLSQKVQLKKVGNEGDFSIADTIAEPVTDPGEIITKKEFVESLLNSSGLTDTQKWTVEAVHGLDGLGAKTLAEVMELRYQLTGTRVTHQAVSDAYIKGLGKLASASKAT